MLVLSRKVGEQTVVADDIRIVILAIQGDRVKLGFEAPGHVTIHREEVHRRVASECAVYPKGADGRAGYRRVDADDLS